ncbi:hypothetical protein BJF78_11295 [Pseudonocardia sp. CNS-139]|nr:hypothetical protein BJF78_11295 [Pseudonocardia sp. CNS-139]
MDLFAVCDALLRSPWLLPLLVVMIAVDAPFPMFPSETLLMSASAMAFGSHDVTLVAGLFVASVVGSVLGDTAVFWLGRCSHRVLRRASTWSAGSPAGCGPGCWPGRGSRWSGRGSCPAGGW